MKDYRLIIVGGGVAAGYAARELVEQGVAPEEVAIVSAEESPPYDRPPLSKAVLQGKEAAPEARIEERQWYREHGIALLLGRTATAVSTDRRTVTLDDGAELGYRELLLATGSAVRTLRGPGADLAGVFYLRTDRDAEAILDAARPGARAVVVGGSFIGTEVAASLAQRGLRVTLVYPQPRLMADGPFTAEASSFLERYFVERGVELVPGERARGFAGDARVAGVALESGRELAADLVVAGIGVTPVTALAEAAGLTVDDGVVVDERLRTGAPGVSAAGDVASWPDRVFAKRRRVEHWDNAQQQGQYWARRVTGASDEPFVHVPYFFSDVFDLSWEYWGDREGADRTATRGEVDEAAFSTWWLRDGRVVAAFVMDRPDEEGEAAERWIREGKRLDAADLEAAESVAEL